MLESLERELGPSEDQVVAAESLGRLLVSICLTGGGL